MTSGPKGYGDSWILVRLDTEASRWQELAQYAFWLRYPAALDSARPGQPPGMEEPAATFRRYGEELNVLEHDLTECLNEFKQAYQVLYREPSAIAQKKFSIVYHVDNFLIRVHKFRENLYRLLALAVGLDHSGRPRLGDALREEQVANALEKRRFTSIAACVQAFDCDPHIAAAIAARNLFVHQFRKDHGRPELEAASRVSDFEDPIARQVSGLTDLPAIDSFADRKADDLLRVLEAIRDFRNTLYWAIKQEFVALVSQRSPETRRRFQPFVDGWNAERDLFRFAE